MSNIKTALILAAGKGKRLNQLDTPKPLVKVGNKPMILHNIIQLQNFGVKKIFIAINDGDIDIKKALSKNPEIKSEINFIESGNNNKDLLGSFASAKDSIFEPFFLLMSDLIIEKNPYELFGDKKDKIQLLISSQEDHFERSGALSKILLKDNSLKFIDSDLSEYNCLEVGIYSFPPDLFNEFLKIAEGSRAADFQEIMQKMINKNKVVPVDIGNCEWFDVNTPATYIRAELFSRRAQEESMHLKERVEMEETSLFSHFYRHKLLQTDIIIERGITKKLDKVRIIPEKNSSSPHFILTDSIIDKLHGERVLQGFLNAGYNVRKLVIPSGEETKNIDVLVKLADDIFSYGMDEDSIVISLGGGVINNIAGFLASTLYRGIGLIHFPTTMMAQVDAAIDFKQAVNSPKGKNLLGSYYPAKKIVIDPEVLLTLEKRHILNGISESIKHALTQSEDFLTFLDDNKKRAVEIDCLEKIIKKTIELKVPLLNGDTKDDYNEMLPQYAHSVGHAVEHLSSYDLLHGEALAIGMCVTAEISKIMNICSQEIVDCHYEICKNYDLPTVIPDYITEEDICNKIKYDKHHLRGFPHMALVERVGVVWSDKGVYGAPVDYAALKKAIKINKSKK